VGVLGADQAGDEGIDLVAPGQAFAGDLIPRVWLRQPEDRLRWRACRRA
jgi:hypothetical protein